MSAWTNVTRIPAPPVNAGLIGRVSHLVDDDDRVGCVLEGVGDEIRADEPAPPVIRMVSAHFLKYTQIRSF